MIEENKLTRWKMSSQKFCRKYTQTFIIKWQTHNFFFLLTLLLNSLLQLPCTSEFNSFMSTFTLHCSCMSFCQVNCEAVKTAYFSLQFVFFFWSKMRIIFLLPVAAVSFLFRNGFFYAFLIWNEMQKKKKNISLFQSLLLSRCIYEQ